MRNWKEYGKKAIFGDKSKGGLLVSFLKEYQIKFKKKPIAGCSKCLDSYWLNYINSTIMKEEKAKCNYELHKKYNGIQLGVNGQPIRNGEMTDKIAEELLKKHPRGEQLFSKIPEKVEKKDSEMSMTELREKYPAIKTTSKKDFLQKVAELK